MIRDFPTADHALTDEEITERFGPLFAEFDAALRADPLLTVEVIERMADTRRKVHAARNARDPEREARAAEQAAQRAARAAQMLARNERIVRLRSLGSTTREICAEVGLREGAGAEGSQAGNGGGAGSGCYRYSGS